MIEFETGDILTADAEALVNTVNCVGIMGKGIALQFKNAFPANFTAYQQACARDQVQPGRMFVFETRQLSGPRYIVNFPTKRHWRGKSRIEDIDSGLRALVAEIRNLHIRSIAIPPLGSGLGGLNWGEVRPRIERALEPIKDLRVIIYEPNDSVYEPNGAPDLRAIAISRKVPEMTPGRASLIVLMSRYLGGMLDPFVTLLEVHKLMYFMQAAGQQLRLRYVRGYYGPYAENLGHVLKQIDGYFISGYADGGDHPSKQLELVPGAIDKATSLLTSDAAVRHRFERVADLVQGFETPFGLELLATVHWVASDSGVRTIRDIVDHTYGWNDRKRQFSERQIGLAHEILVGKHWLPPTISPRL